jgi:hypothetical protein
MKLKISYGIISIIIIDFNALMPNLIVIMEDF